MCTTTDMTPPPHPLPTCEEAERHTHVHHALPVPLSTGMHHAQVAVHKAEGGASSKTQEQKRERVLGCYMAK